MADFCKQCSVEVFGEDSLDLADITKLGDQMASLYVKVLCETCGFIQVDWKGNCISYCLNNHRGKSNDK